jgi:hypothetical protein
MTPTIERMTNATGGETPEIDLLMASLRADGSDATTYFAVLYGKLSDALGSSVVTKRGGLLHKHGAPSEFSLSLGEHEFCASLANGAITCADKHTVRGVALSSTPLGFAEWLERLVGALADEAARSASARMALERLLA